MHHLLTILTLHACAMKLSTETRLSLTNLLCNPFGKREQFGPVPKHSCRNPPPKQKMRTRWTTQHVRGNTKLASYCSSHLSLPFVMERADHTSLAAIRSV
ncbi:hypothetical protein SEVIR_2G378401v4 [Setaria viridis]